MSQALRDAVYLGIPTNVDFLRRVVDDAAFRTAQISTDMLKHRPELAAGPAVPANDHVLAAAVLCQALGGGAGNGGAPSNSGAGAGAGGSTSAWQSFGAFRGFEGVR